MGRWFEHATRLTMAGLLAAGLLVVSGPSIGAAVARSSECPPATIQRLAGERPVTCYGSRTLTFRAYVQRPCIDGCGGISATLTKPRWLDGLVGSYVLLGSGPRSASIQGYVPPALGRCAWNADLNSCPFHPYEGHWATVQARFNDPIAQTCRYAAGHPPGAEFSRKVAIAECTADLVVLSVGPAAPETDVALAVVKDPAGGPASPTWVATFVVALLLAARRFPLRRLRPDRGLPDEPRARSTAPPQHGRVMPGSGPAPRKGSRGVEGDMG